MRSKATFVALLRAVNVGGAGKIPMGDLKQICASAGFENIRTYIASGNVVFCWAGTEGEAKDALEEGLFQYAGKRTDVVLRTGADLARVLADNPFPHGLPQKTVAIFLDHAPPADTLLGVTGQADEEVQLGAREIYIHYRSGMGRSKLRIRNAQHGTARNMNTIAALAAMAAR
jgi:uncharacterized protein (DUF1697 family)